MRRYAECRNCSDICYIRLCGSVGILGWIWIEYRWRHRIPVAIFSRQCNLDEYSRRHSGELHGDARQYNLLQITNYLFE
jgi:hypothetical protein